MSPYQLPDPEAVRTVSASAEMELDAGERTDPEAEATVHAQRDMPAVLRALRELEPLVVQKAGEAEAEALAAFEDAPEVEELRQVGPSLRTTFTEAANAIREVGRNVELSAQGKDERCNAIRRARKERLDQIAEARLSTAGDRLLRRFRGELLGNMTASEAATASFLFQSFPVKAPSTFALESISALRSAVVDSLTPAERHSAHMLLANAYLPLNERRGQAPEQFARQYAPVSRKIAGLISSYLDVVLNRASVSLASEFVEACRTDFTWAVVTATEQDGWDAAIEVGAPSFTWD